MNKIHLENLYFLAYENGSQAAVARQLGMKHEELIRYFNNKNIYVSNEFAKKIEKTFNKPDGWMDRENANLALSSDEWGLIEKYRSANDHDKLLIRGLADLVNKSRQDGSHSAQPLLSIENCSILRGN